MLKWSATEVLVDGYATGTVNPLPTVDESDEVHSVLGQIMD
jgi:hypothetical protein